MLYTVIGYYDIRLVSSGEFLIEEEGVRWVIKMAMIEIDTIFVEIRRDGEIITLRIIGNRGDDILRL